METSVVVSEIRARLKNPVGKNLVKSEINSIIDIINVELGARRALATITTGETMTDWEDATGDWDATDDEWDAATTYSGFSYNETDFILTLSSDTVKVEKIWVDNEEWQHRTYAEVKNSDNSDAKYYYFTGRQIHFPADVSSNVIKMQLRLNYAYLTDELITLPNNYKQLLVSGCIYRLTDNEQALAIHKKIYDKHLADIFLQKCMVETNQDRVRNYDYQGTQYGR